MKTMIVISDMNSDVRGNLSKKTIALVTVIFLVPFTSLYLKQTTIHHTYLVLRHAISGD